MTWEKKSYRYEISLMDTLEKGNYLFKLIFNMKISQKINWVFYCTFIYLKNVTIPGLNMTFSCQGHGSMFVAQKIGSSLPWLSAGFKQNLRVL